MNILHLILAIVLAYPLLLAVLGVALVVRGQLGREELLPGPWVIRILQVVLWPIWRGRIAGITLGFGTVFLVSDPHEPLRAHEACHRHQSWRRAPIWLIARHHVKTAMLVGATLQGFAYSWEFLKRGYWLNVFEQEARIVSGEENGETRT